MKLKWLGHSCFLLTTAAGVRVLMDPFSSKIGLHMPTVEADIVTMSHDHQDHNNQDAAKGPYTVINKPGRCEKDGVEVLGVATAHDDKNGSQRGKNIVFKVTADGISVCHCGDLGHTLTAEQLKVIGHVDVLLIPVGGFYTIDAQTAARIVMQVGPAVTIPMHYKVEGLGYPIQGVEPFLKVMGKSKNAGSAEIELTPGTLANYAGVVVMDHN